MIQEAGLFTIDRLHFLRLSAMYVLGALMQSRRQVATYWLPRAHAIPHPVLRHQAVTTIRAARFHYEGAAVYATGLKAPDAVITASVAFQAIADYLDTIGDSADELGADDHHRLHGALLDAVDPGRARGGYYDFHPHRDDGGYLGALVGACRGAVAQLAGYAAVAPTITRVTKLLIDFQERRHTYSKSDAERAFERWSRELAHEGHTWPETVAAYGSPLGVFALFRLAAQPDPGRFAVSRCAVAYLSAIGRLQVLLDEYTDQADDAAGGRLNLVSYYGDERARYERLIELVRQAMAAAAGLPEPSFHKWVIAGLAGIALGDPKVVHLGRPQAWWTLTQSAGPEAAWIQQFVLLWHRLAGAPAGGP